jgi:hypothetical protein
MRSVPFGIRKFTAVAVEEMLVTGNEFTVFRCADAVACGKHSKLSNSVAEVTAVFCFENFRANE